MTEPSAPSSGTRDPRFYILPGDPVRWEHRSEAGSWVTGVMVRWTAPETFELDVMAASSHHRKRVGGRFSFGLYCGSIRLMSDVERDTQWSTDNPKPVDTTPPAKDPMDVEYDGRTLRDLLQGAENLRRAESVTPMTLPGWCGSSVYTPSQRAALSAHWSSELRKRIESGRSADREAWKRSQQPSILLDCAEDL